MQIWLSGHFVKTLQVLSSLSSLPWHSWRYMTAWQIVSMESEYPFIKQNNNCVCNRNITPTLFLHWKRIEWEHMLSRAPSSSDLGIARGGQAKSCVRLRPLLHMKTWDALSISKAFYFGVHFWQHQAIQHTKSKKSQRILHSIRHGISIAPHLPYK